MPSTFFDRALESDAAYVPALVGRGQALLELGRDGDALASFEAARQGRSVADRSAAAASRCCASAPCRTTSRAQRRRATRAAGRKREPPTRRRSRRRRSRVSLSRSRAGGAEGRRAGAGAGALPQGAVARCHPTPSRTRRSARILEEQGDVAGALDAYAKARAIDPAEVPTERIAKLRELAALAKLPAEYRAIPARAGASRGREVAALIGVRLRAARCARPASARWSSPTSAVTGRSRGLPAWSAPASWTRSRTTPSSPTPGAPRRSGADGVARADADCGRQSPRRPKPGRAHELKIADVPPGHLELSGRLARRSPQASCRSRQRHLPAASAGDRRRGRRRRSARLEALGAEP